MSEIETGPIDYLVVEWTAGRPPTGEAFPHLIELVDRGIIRVLDFAFVQKGEDGTVAGVAIEDLDLDGNSELTLFAGAASGLLGDEDIAETGAVLEPGCSAAVLVYENAWAAPFASALRRSGAQLVASGRIPINAVMAALDELEASEAT